MDNITITIYRGNGEIKATKAGNDQLVLVYDGNYEPGDQIVFSTKSEDHYYLLRADDCIDEAFVYISDSQAVFTVPFDEKKSCYNPKSFIGERHVLSMRLAKAFEINAYRNIALNPLDQPGNTGFFPHAWANVETRGEAQFFARNAIDGVLANESHGSWPYQSWGINRQEDAEITIDFGREVVVDQVIVYLRADFPHDNWWTQALLTFSDGTSQLIQLGKSADPFIFELEKKNIRWIKMSQMLKAEDPSPFPALKQIQVYGTERIN